MKRVLLLENASSVDMANGRDKVEEVEDKWEGQRAK